MIQPAVVAESDCWSDWLLRDRHGGNAAQERSIRTAVAGYVDRVLDAARLAPGMTLADIGTGDGVVAFRAIERVGPSLRVLMADISAQLLLRAESVAAQRGLSPQCQFHRSPADGLNGIADASVDVLTTRSALAYVPDKPAALREFYRVLKSGGRISIAEPVMQDDAASVVVMRRLLDAGLESRDAILPLLHKWKSAQYPDTAEKMALSPIANYSERDLLDLFRDCGFVEIHLELHIDVRRAEPRDWQGFLDTAPHPLAPSLRTILRQHFSDGEAAALERAIRPLIEAGPATEVDRIVYLSADKPA